MPSVALFYLLLSKMCDEGIQMRVTAIQQIKKPTASAEKVSLNHKSRSGRKYRSTDFYYIRIAL